ncbi:transcription factor LHW-like isoform X2 [Trifolium pratense]|uniref:transcription factor LHW-like isoform X2 n=1 Tax=Trifolium pratense TaxID=57577 RepID=UPI001E6960BA|nr:transcription factor LHW-like isoform X2 [Trifolium pratense]
MGFLLKQALKTLCARNQWSYAVFWKIGCNNSKLLIWEDCYYEPLPSAFLPQIVGTSNLPYRDGEGCWFSSDSQLRIQEDDRVGSLINKMMVNSSVNVAGQGILGRAAFTGNHQWIVLNNFIKDAYPPEVLTEVHCQFSAGMQTVAVIPVLPHGVVQLGSFLPIMENIGFVNDVKNLIFQLGCVPGALLSEDYSARLSNGSVTGCVPVSFDPQIITPSFTSSVANGSNQPSTSSHGPMPVASQLPPFRSREINSHRGTVLTPQSQNLNQIFDSLSQPKAQRENTTVKAEAEVIPANLDSSCLQPRSVSYNARSAFNELTDSNVSNLNGFSLKHMEQQMLSGIGRQSHGNPNMNPSSSGLNMSRSKTDGGQIYYQNSNNTSFLGGIPICSGMNNNLLRTNMINCSVSNSPQFSTTGYSGTQKVEFGIQNNNSTKAANHMHVEAFDQKNLSNDLKHAQDALASTDQRIDDLLEALKIPSSSSSLHHEEHVPMNDHIPDFLRDCLDKDVTNHQMMKTNFEQEEACTQLSSGDDDLFDVLGLDFKRKLLNGNWNLLFADETDASAEKHDKKAMCKNFPVVGHDNIFPVNEAISNNGMFSGTSTDHLLDAVVSKNQSAANQNSDEMSCRTTVTRISTASVLSPTGMQIMRNHVGQAAPFDFPKTEVKTGAAETSSLISGGSKDNVGNCSQTTSIYGSQLSSWVENSSTNMKRENSVSTGYSKRPDEVSKSNRKRLKPGENPRPRPKDRQMIQDRVKELREIVPNGAKCSIDALLERTIKHMLFLQSVTKHADKLKQTGESKIISKEGGLLLKDNFEGGATWAYEVGSQSMVCPIIVEDLNHPRQMLVEMLCEERGFFLEIADLIRGLGLTILKGVMEARNDKIWARFSVEANRDVTRMEIFMSLVRLLEQTVKGGASSSNAAVDNNNMMVYHSIPQST